MRSGIEIKTPKAILGYEEKKKEGEKEQEDEWVEVQKDPKVQIENKAWKHTTLVYNGILYT